MQPLRDSNLTHLLDGWMDVEEIRLIPLWWLISSVLQ